MRLDRSQGNELKGDSAKFLLIVLGLVLGAVAVSSQSYWIDEASTVDKSIRPTVVEWWERLRAEATSNMQLPLYLLYAWGWDKLFGRGEWAMRAANIPWFVLGLVAIGSLFTGPAWRRVVACSGFLLSGFAWFYLNEARPYTMQLGASCVVFVALLRLSDGDGLPATQARKWVWMLAVGAVVLSASGALAMLWLGGGLLAAVLASPWLRTRRLLVDHWPIWATTGGLLLAVGAYYLWTLTLGARPTVLARTDLKSVLFTVYEMLGFLGLGPSRLAIRSGGLEVFKPYLAGLLAYGLLVAGVLGLGWRRLGLLCSRKRLCWVAICCGGVAALLVVVGMTSRFRLLGRHCMPMMPVLLYVLGLGLGAAWEERGKAWRVVAMGFLGLSFISCVLLRFDPRHAKDDYRGAAALARAAVQKGERVWWNADEEAAVFYGVPLAKAPAGRGQVVWIGPGWEGLEADGELPDLVLASKPDVYDGNGRVVAWLARSGFRPAGTLVAFTIWRRKE